ncbi:hypothetical protein [Polynucleobacter sphagniphilus]|uniref:hypothetical protein n=1 Tax=Polynucleobacter sphagniphilus TaxID=1743169 RepID=UPI0024758218|nr:hypothetical protein [Polynucleobacter sphagniphilus]
MTDRKHVCPNEIKQELINSIKKYTDFDNLYFLTKNDQFIVEGVSYMKCGCCDEQRLVFIGEEMK